VQNACSRALYDMLEKEAEVEGKTMDEAYLEYLREERH